MIPAIEFDIVWLLPLAVVLPLLSAWLVHRGHRKREERIRRMGTMDVVSRLLPENTLRKPTGRMIRLGTAGALLGIAAAGPRWGFERSVMRSAGIDMVLSLDASLSMMADDESPSRLDRMKQEVRRLRAASPGDRVGLLAFAGKSYILSPLTVDAGALDLFLDNLDPSVVGQAGSSLAATIRQGVELLGLTRSGADRALVIMSDGEAFEPVEEVVAEAKRLREQGISLVTVGFGTPAGARIPIEEDGRRTFKRDEQGQIVVTRYQPEYLQAAADAAGGTFIAAEETDKAGKVKIALATLRTQARASLGTENRVLRFQWFAIPAVLLLLFDTLVAERRGRRRLMPAAAHTATAMLMLLTLGAGGCMRFTRHQEAVRAFDREEFQRSAALYRAAMEAGDRDPETLYNFGTALLRADSLEMATEVFERLADAKDEELRYRALFNLGLAHLVRGLDSTSQNPGSALEAALATYKKVILMRPDDIDAKWNYELALRKQQSGGGGGGGGGQGDSQDPQQDPSEQEPQPQGGLGQRQAEQLLGSAAREERDVQAKRQQKNRAQPPPGGKDW